MSRPESETILRDLNEAQREAVTHRGSPLLVVAGPGTGKTRVVTHRVAWSICQGIDPERLVAVTFTNRAAAEMRERVGRLAGESGARARVGTFHWLCNTVLRRHAHTVGRDRGFHLLAPYEARAVLLEAARYAVPGIAAGRPITGAVSALKNGASRERAASAGRIDAPTLDAIASEYARRLRAMNALDLDDLQTCTVELLEQNDRLRDRVRSSLADLLIDEFQDTNPVQHRLLAALAPDNGNIMAVGDDDQAIYGWRYASGDAFGAFQRGFPEAHAVVLDETYRAGKLLLRAAGTVIARNDERVRRSLKSNREAGDAPVCVATDDEHDEARWIASEIRRLHSVEGADLASAAILYRVNAQSRAIEDALTAAGIPYTVVGARRFYARPDVVSVLSALRLAVDPEFDRAAEHLLRQVRGVGDRRMTSILERVGNQHLLPALQSGDATVALPADVRRRCSDLAAMLDPAGSLRRQSVAAAIDWAIGIARAVHEVPEDDTDDALAELRGALREMAGSRGTLRQLVERLAGQGDDSPGTTGVRLMSLHAAKGLEFDVVFVAGMEEGLLPHQRSLDSKRDIAEERRLCYVGMTRARQTLYLTYARTRMLGGRALLGTPSRFIAEMGPGNVTQVSTSRSRAHPRLSRVDMGDRVYHTRWHEGTVIDVEGTGRETLVTIHFDGVGGKRLQLCHAPLRRVE